jgi:hypothetical protein
MLHFAMRVDSILRCRNSFLSLTAEAGGDGHRYDRHRLAGYGLFPGPRPLRAAAHLRVRAIDDALINWMHVGLLLVLAVSVTIDVMKPTFWPCGPATIGGQGLRGRSALRGAVARLGYVFAASVASGEQVGQHFGAGTAQASQRN